MSPRGVIRELGGGVSNSVFLADVGQWIVVKQSLGKLRVEQEWLSDRTRIHRECEAIRALAELLPEGDVPKIVFEDRANCIYAMTAAPEGAQDWKSILMATRCAEPRIVEQAAALLCRMIEVSRHNSRFEQRFGDLRVFDQLRLDPYYRATARRHPDLEDFFTNLIGETSDRRYSLVHGDWSPKNLLVSGHGLMAIDFEVIHYGDPAFDTAFLLNHLVLKSLFLDAPELRDAALAVFARVHETIDENWFEAAVVRHLAALLLARVDGKSPAEYIRGTALEDVVREIARGLILDPPSGIVATMKRVRT